MWTVSEGVQQVRSLVITSLHLFPSIELNLLGRKLSTLTTAAACGAVSALFTGANVIPSDDHGWPKRGQALEAAFYARMDSGLHRLNHGMETGRG